jgi:hypothetical protein
MADTTGCQKLFEAVLVLACERGPIEERLMSAYRLTLVSIDPQVDLPKDLQTEFQLLRTELQNLFFGVAPDTADATRKQQASQAARRVVALYDALVRAGK